MIKRFLTTKVFLVIFLLALLAAAPVQNSKADIGGCATAVAEAAQATAERQAACSSVPQGGACLLAIAAECQAVALASAQCS